MYFDHTNCQILTVNYNTPDLILEQYKSIRYSLGDKFVVNIVDGSDNVFEDTQTLNDILSEDPFVNHCRLGYNIHHGPGMDYGINLVDSKYILIMDSDISIKSKNILQYLNTFYVTDFYAIGDVVCVDKNGINVLDSKHDSTSPTYNYCHPSFMILCKEQYKKYKPFMLHGAPCIQTMIELCDLNLQHLVIKLPKEYMSLLNCSWGVTQGRFGIQIPGY